MEFGDSFKRFLLENSIPAEVVTIGDREPFIFLSSLVVTELITFSYAMVVENGGLIIGNFHTQGGIHMLKPFEGGFEYVGEMEGYEFLFSATATENYLDKIHELNNSIKHDKEIEPRPFRVPRHIKKVNLSKLKFQIIILPGRPQYILNRTATEKHIELLDQMNDERKMKRLLRLFKL